MDILSPSDCQAQFYSLVGELFAGQLIKIYDRQKGKAVRATEGRFVFKLDLPLGARPKLGATRPSSECRLQITLPLIATVRRPPAGPAREVAASSWLAKLRPAR